jgi:hypothetical protein
MSKGNKKSDTEVQHLHSYEDDDAFVYVGDAEIRFLTVEVLLGRYKIEPAVVATAVEQGGVFAFDPFQRLGPATPEQIIELLRLLAAQAQWAIAPNQYSDVRSPIEETVGECGGPYSGYGWPKARVPHFESIRQAMVRSQLEVGSGKVQRPSDGTLGQRGTGGGRISRSAAAPLEKLLSKLEANDPNFSRMKMPGQKADFLALAIKVEGLDLVLSTFTTYLKGVCKFRQGARPTDYYRKALERLMKQGFIK